MPRELVDASAGADASDAEGSAARVAAAEGPEVAEASEAEEVIDAAEQRLVDAFGPVARWWTGELPGLGVMRLPLP